MLTVKLECKRCGYTWKPKVKGKEPAVCPKCTSPYWKTKRQQLVCAVCRHKWFQKGNQKPKHCPKCWCLKWENAELIELRKLTKELETFNKTGQWTTRETTDIQRGKLAHTNKEGTNANID